MCRCGAESDVYSPRARMRASGGLQGRLIPNSTFEVRGFPEVELKQYISGNGYFRAVLIFYADGRDTIG